jgi:hypothetical protein
MDLYLSPNGFFLYTVYLLNFPKFGDPWPIPSLPPSSLKGRGNVNYSLQRAEGWRCMPEGKHKKLGKNLFLWDENIY